MQEHYLRKTFTKTLWKTFKISLAFEGRPRVSKDLFKQHLEDIERAFRRPSKHQSNKQNSKALTFFQRRLKGIQKTTF